MPISFRVRATRMAISPRLAMSTFWNTAAQSIYVGRGGSSYPLQTRSLRSLLSVWRGYDDPPSPAVVRLRRHGHRAVEGQVLIELQSHSVVSDGQLEPAGVVAEAAKAGVTTLALTDHDAVAGGPEAGEG